MRTKVIIENGQTTIKLFAENDFERDVIEKVNATVSCSIEVGRSFGVNENHRIEIIVK